MSLRFLVESPVSRGQFSYYISFSVKCPVFIQHTEAVLLSNYDTQLDAKELL